MIMTFTPPDHLTGLGEIILNILREVAPAWLTRSQIAAKLERNRLIPYDLAQLEYLISSGLIEVREAKRGFAGKRFEYRAKDGE